MEAAHLLAIVFIMGMTLGAVLIGMAMRQRSQQAERLHKERLAMIERGLTPTRENLQGHDGAHPPRAASRSLSLGIIVVALGVGLMSIISIAGGSPEIGFGIGGAVVVLGAAFIVVSKVTRPSSPLDRPIGPRAEAAPPPDERA